MSHTSPVRLADIPSPKGMTWEKPTLENTNGGQTYVPSHPEQFRVEFGSPSGGPSGGAGAKKGMGQPLGGMKAGFASRLVAVRDFSPYEIITPITNVSRVKSKAYSSIQCGPGVGDHIELNSDLLFMNHSCFPTIEVMLPPLRTDSWAVRAGPRGLKAGEGATFFYPSTEWDMAQGFECACGSNECLRYISGAKTLTMEQLKARGYINDHIRTLKLQQLEGQQVRR